MRLYTPDQLMIDQLRDLISVQEQLMVAQPALMAMSTHARLKALLREHHEETRQNCITLQRIFEQMNATRNEDHCQAVEGLLRGGEEHLREVPNPAVRDLMMIAHCVRIEGYEIVAHEFTAYLAGQCGHPQVAEMVMTMLDGHSAMKREIQNLQDEIFETTKPSQTILSSSLTILA